MVTACTAGTGTGFGMLQKADELHKQSICPDTGLRFKANHLDSQISV